MSYYTKFNLTYSYAEPSLDNEDDEVLQKKICEALAEISVYLEKEDVDDMLSYFVEHSWYDYEDDMKALARKFPKLRFLLKELVKNRVICG